MIKIAHIVNPVNTGEENELYWQQPITFASMIAARKFAKKTAKGKVDVELFCVGYEEDTPAMPEGFTRLSDLHRSVLDIRQFTTKQRKLPLFRDILDALESCTDNNAYMIQTNVDICLMPHFYTTVAAMIEKGHRGLIINKRILPPIYCKTEELPLMYAEIGGDHNGYDCFVFEREVYHQYSMGNVCMGTPWSETTLAANMACYCDNLTVLKKSHLTFHIGDSRTWMQLYDYRQHNIEEFAKVVMQLHRRFPDYILKHEIIQWLIKKLRWEFKPHYSEDCHKLCDMTAYLT